MKRINLVLTVAMAFCAGCNQAPKTQVNAAEKRTTEQATPQPTDRQTLMDALVKMPDSSIKYWEWPVKQREAFAKTYLETGKAPVQKEFSKVEEATDRTIVVRVVDGIFQLILYKGENNKNLILVRSSAGGDEDLSLYHLGNGKLVLADSRLIRNAVYTMLVDKSPRNIAKTDSMLRAADFNFNNPDAIKVNMEAADEDVKLFRDTAFTLRFSPQTLMFTARQ